jgi:hypothetical protein
LSIVELGAASVTHARDAKHDERYSRRTLAEELSGKPAETSGAETL